MCVLHGHSELEDACLHVRSVGEGLITSVGLGKGEGDEEEEEEAWVERGVRGGGAAVREVEKRGAGGAKRSKRRSSCERGREERSRRGSKEMEKGRRQDQERRRVKSAETEWNDGEKQKRLRAKTGAMEWKVEEMDERSGEEEENSEGKKWKGEEG
ncbi:hypothetical protein Pcinc_005625 [Petrolisthes cinctipes]|uniref:Uncharacterized protein n=1 Tax=Petrolisthes cinctipes TaxID=88211 RepID=A0AAE1GC92_PETCI|nr:hypothetical protein Pcinc_005625 [Petrolisthes cinctipes]